MFKKIVVIISMVFVILVMGNLIKNTSVEANDSKMSYDTLYYNKIIQANNELFIERGNINHNLIVSYDNPDSLIYWIKTIQSVIGNSMMVNTDKEALKMAIQIYTSCKYYNEDVIMALSVARVETKNFNPYAVSPKGAIGLWQIMPATGKYMCNVLNIPFDNRFSPDSLILTSNDAKLIKEEILRFAINHPKSIEAKLLDPVFNIRIGIAYLSRLKVYGLNQKERLICYNIGIANYKNNRYLVTGTKYHTLVMAEYQKIQRSI